MKHNGSFQLLWEAEDLLQAEPSCTEYSYASVASSGASFAGAANRSFTRSYCKSHRTSES